MKIVFKLAHSVRKIFGSRHSVSKTGKNSPKNGIHRVEVRVLCKSAAHKAEVALFVPRIFAKMAKLSAHSVFSGFTLCMYFPQE